VGKDIGIARLTGGRLLLIGVVAVLLLAYASASGPLGGAPIPGGAQPVVDRAIDDLVERTGTDRESIIIAAVEPVNWPDTSLGCPRPDMMYAQVITPGYRILLSYEGQTYEYHSDGGTRIVYCGQR
jgi:hypothetical protein